MVSAEGTVGEVSVSMARSLDFGACGDGAGQHNTMMVHEEIMGRYDSLFGSGIHEEVIRWAVAGYSLPSASVLEGHWILDTRALATSRKTTGEYSGSRRNE